jgi:hypothetical protein
MIVLIVNNNFWRNIMNKYYLKESDRVIADSVDYVFRKTYAGGHLVMVCNGAIDGCKYRYKGVEVQFDSDDRAYVLFD